MNSGCPGAYRVAVAWAEPSGWMEHEVLGRWHTSAFHAGAHGVEIAERDAGTAAGLMGPLGEIECLPGAGNVLGDAPGKWGHAAVPGPPRLVRMAIHAGSAQDGIDVVRHRQVRLQCTFLDHGWIRSRRSGDELQRDERYHSNGSENPFSLRHALAV